MGKHHSPPLQYPQDPEATADEPHIAAGYDPAKLLPPPPSDYSLKPQINGSRLVKKNKKRAVSDAASTSSSEIVSHAHSRDLNNYSQRGIRIASKRRNPRFCVRRAASDVEAIALPLGMSIAAVLAQVLERKDLTNGKASIDQLSTICTSAVRESLSNVFGDRYDSFARNFEKSFGSTLSTLRLIRNSSVDDGSDLVGQSNLDDHNPDTTSTFYLKKGKFSLESYDVSAHCTESKKCEFEMEEYSDEEEVEDKEQPSVSMNRELSLRRDTDQQISSHNQSYSSNLSMLSTIEKSVIEQTRANDLKSLEIGLIMRKLKLKETQLDLSSDSNFLERCKLILGVSRTSFKAEKFKTQLEETRHSELLRTCADFLVADLLIMSACLCYGVYAFSYDKIHQLTKSCSSSAESKSWWIPRPMATFNTGLQTLNCQVQVYSRMLFGIMMILAIAYILIQRSTISRHAMPITFIVLLLGAGCGVAGKYCVDTLGGDGNHWLVHWEVLCALHFFANVFTSTLFYILNGSVQVSQGIKPRSVFPYWIRRLLFYLILLLAPFLCGLLPFASTRTWWEEHFSKLIRNHLLAAYDENHVDEVDLHE